MAAAKCCFVCDDAIINGEPRIEVAGVVIHEYCAVESGNVCDDDGCMYWRCVHGGECVK